MVLLLDIGGTHMRLAVSDDGKTFARKSVIIKTPLSYAEALQKIIANAEALGEGKLFDAIVGGMAGVIDYVRGIIIHSTHLRSWNGAALKKDLSDHFKTVVTLENDAALAAVGEAVHGAGKGREIVAYFTVSTGVGGARVVGGRLDRRVFGFEPGHQIIGSNAGELICLDNIISGSAIEKKFTSDPILVSDEKFWAESARLLAIGLHNSILHWSPHIVVLGGPLMQKISLAEVQAHLKKILNIFPECPELSLAVLGQEGGLWGALEFYNQTR
jgi:predicted NBD/HSP70 family sugar kinase